MANSEICGVRRNQEKRKPASFQAPYMQQAEKQSFQVVINNAGKW